MCLPLLIGANERSPAIWMVAALISLYSLALGGLDLKRRKRVQDDGVAFSARHIIG
jgi:hypothetical protein